MKRNTIYFLIIIAFITTIVGCKEYTEEVEWDRVLYKNNIESTNWSFSKIEVKLYDDLHDVTYTHLTYIGDEDIETDKIDVNIYLPNIDSEQKKIELFMSSIVFENISEVNYIENIEKGRIVGTSESILGHKDLSEMEIREIIVEIIYEMNGESRQELFEVELDEL